MNILFTCGGTAGHVNPAVALARIFQERNPDCKVPGSNMLANSNVIDIYMGEGSYHDCILWGAQDVEVYIRATAEAEQPAQ